MTRPKNPEDRESGPGAPCDDGRRTLLKSLLLAPVVGVTGASCEKFRGPTITARPAAEGGFLVTTRQLATLKTPANAIYVRAPGVAKKISLRKLADGTYFALYMKCTHWGCTVEPLPDVNSCPCHGSEYDLLGRVTRGPASKPLLRLAVTVVPGGVQVARPPVAKGPSGPEAPHTRSAGGSTGSP